MSVATFLHLYRAGETTVRAVALTTDIVRIGRGPLCEIRLSGDNVAAVQMVLRRRGGQWSIQPIGGAGRVRLDGETLEETTRFVPGVFAQIGDYRLTLVEVDPVAIEDEPGSFARPIVLGSARPITASQVEEIANDAPELRADPIEVEPILIPSETIRAQQSSSSSDPVTRWREVVDRTGEWLDARRREVPGTGSWATSRPAAPEPLAPEPREPRPRRSSLEARAYPRWSAPRVTPTGEQKVKYEPTQSRPAAFQSATPDRVAPAPKTSSQRTNPTPVSNDQDPEETNGDWLDAEEQAARIAWESDPAADVETAQADFDLPEDFEQISTRAVDAELYVESTEPPAELPFEDGPTVLVEPSQKANPNTEWRFVSANDRDNIVEEREPEIRRDRLSRPIDDLNCEDQATEEHWPSVATILPAILRSDAPDDSATLRRAPLHGPSPTLSMPPRVVAIPLWLALPTVLGGSLIVGIVALGLSVTWANDSRVAGPIVSRWLAGDVSENGGRAEPVPVPSWWASTTQNLYLHAASLGSAPRDALDREDARTLLDLADVSTPGYPGVRYARVAEAGKSTAKPSEPVVPPSRDIASLGLAATRDSLSGATAIAAEEMKSALRMALSLDPEVDDYPAVDRDGSGMRLLLPHEALISSILRTYKTASGAPGVAWDSLVPEHAGLWLAVYRLERTGPRSKSREILDRINAMPDNPPAGGNLAWHRAAKAEALALAERWEPAEVAYQAALEATPGHLLASVIWFNLSDVQARRSASDASRQSRRTARRLAADLGNRPSEQARQLHEGLESEGAAR